MFKPKIKIIPTPMSNNTQWLSLDRFLTQEGFSENNPISSVYYYSKTFGNISLEIYEPMLDYIRICIIDNDNDDNNNEEIYSDKNIIKNIKTLIRKIKINMVLNNDKV